MTIEDANTEYYVEVEASEIPSKIEVVSAIASIEEQEEQEDPNDTDPQDPNYDPTDDIENIEVTERKFVVKYAEDTTVVKASKAKKRKKLDLLDNEEIVDLAKPLMKKKKVSLSQLLDGLDESKFTCYYCDKMFRNRKFLNEHFKKHLDSNGNFPCRVIYSGVLTTA